MKTVTLLLLATGILGCSSPRRGDVATKPQSGISNLLQAGTSRDVGLLSSQENRRLTKSYAKIASLIQPGMSRRNLYALLPPSDPPQASTLIVTANYSPVLFYNERHYLDSSHYLDVSYALNSKDTQKLLEKFRQKSMTDLVNGSHQRRLVSSESPGDKILRISKVITVPVKPPSGNSNYPFATSE